MTRRTSHGTILIQATSGHGPAASPRPTVERKPLSLQSDIEAPDETHFELSVALLAERSVRRPVGPASWPPWRSVSLCTVFSRLRFSP